MTLSFDKRDPTATLYPYKKSFTFSLRKMKKIRALLALGILVLSAVSLFSPVVHAQGRFDNELGQGTKGISSHVLSDKVDEK
ncbi:hypothetical protein FACS189428_1800 [Clostridia bacterium]|nr:hypothetical protein FACS189428_1800 [Clostridia bacterium]